MAQVLGLGHKSMEKIKKQQNKKKFTAWPPKN